MAWTCGCALGVKQSGGERVASNMEEYMPALCRTCGKPACAYLVLVDVGGWFCIEHTPWAIELARLSEDLADVQTRLNLLEGLEQRRRVRG